MATGDNRLPFDRSPDQVDSPNSYALSGKIMLTAIIVLFVVVVFLVVHHLYARWYLLRMQRRHINRRRSTRHLHRNAHLVFYVDPDNPNNAVTVPTAGRGLPASVLSSLPVFVYSSKTHPGQLDCAVCLSEFEEDEKGRSLPKCHHSFHTDCIDMWFHTHSTCPLCRSPVEPVPEPPPPDQNDNHVIVVPVCPEPGPSSGNAGEATSSGERRKGLGMVIEVPRGTESAYELSLASPASQGFRSPGSRLLSLKRILSMNRKSAAVSPSSRSGTSCAAELDVESALHESTQGISRAQTPR